MQEPRVLVAEIGASADLGEGGRGIHVLDYHFLVS